MQLKRPKTFNDVIGHEKVKDLLINSLNREVLDFVIFNGQEGIGKTTLSKIYAKHIICKNLVNGLACEECSNCKQANEILINENRDIADVRIFTMSDESGKTAAREILDFIRQLPQTGKYKVVIMEELQGILRVAQDLMLPALENLPKDTIIIGNTTEVNVLEKTFRRRASVLNLKIPAKNETVNLLAEACKQEQIHYDHKATLTKIVETCEGKPATALKGLQTIACSQEQVTSENVNTFLNIVNEKFHLEYLRLLRGDMGIILDFIDHLEENEVDIINFLNGLNKFLVKLLTLRYRTVYLHENIMKKAKEFLKETDENDLLKIQSIVADEVPKITSEENAKPSLISLTFKIMSRNNKSILTDRIKSVTQVEKEKELAMKKSVERIRQQEMKNDIQSKNLQDNPNTLLEGFDARVIKRPNS